FPCMAAHSAASCGAAVRHMFFHLLSVRSWAVAKVRLCRIYWFTDLSNGAYVRIFYAGEVQATCRHRSAGHGAVLASDDRMHVLGGLFPTADFHQRTHDGPYHVAQKAVGGNVKNQPVATYPFPFG